MEQADKLFPEGSKYPQLPFWEHIEPGKRVEYKNRGRKRVEMVGMKRKEYKMQHLKQDMDEG